MDSSQVLHHLVVLFGVTCPFWSDNISLGRSGALYEEALKVNLTLSISLIIVDLLDQYQLSMTQFVPNA